MNIRHGDVLLHSVKEAEGEIIKHDGTFVVAYGEATGHHHTLTVKKPEDLEIRKDEQGRMFFVLKAEGTLTHQEHAPLTVPIGVYEKKQEREVDYFANGVVRKVID